MAPSVVGAAVVPLVQLLAIGRFVSTAFLGGLFRFTIWYCGQVRARADPTE
jgi:hypothetical protein